MASPSLSSRDYEVIKNRTLDLLQNIIDHVNVHYYPQLGGLESRLDRHALGARRTAHVDALQGSGISWVTHWYLKMRLTLAEGQPLMDCRVHAPESPFIAGSNSTHEDQAYPFDDAPAELLEPMRLWLRQRLRAEIEKDYAYATVCQVLGQCTTAGQLMRYMPGLMKLPPSRGYDKVSNYNWAASNERYGEILFKKSEASYDAAAHRKPDLEEKWKPAIEVSEGILARGLLLDKIKTTDSKLMTVAFANYNLLEVVPVLKLAPEGLKVPPFETAVSAELTA